MVHFLVYSIQLYDLGYAIITDKITGYVSTCALFNSWI